MNLIFHFPVLTILLSLLSSVICTLLKAKTARIWTMAVETLLLGMCAAVLVHTLQTGEAFTYVLGEFPAPWGNELRAGALEGLMGFVFSAVLLCSLGGGLTYSRIDVEESKGNLFYALVNLAGAALMALVWTNDVFTGYVFLEILTLSSCGLIAVREMGRTTLAAVRYMIMNLLGSGLFLLGVVMMYSLTGHLLMIPMRGAVQEIMREGGRTPLTFALTILTIGLGIKSGMFPAYFWMPDTYGSATPAAASILSSVVSKGYLFLLFKILYRVAGETVFRQLPLRWVLFLLGLMGIAAGSVSALRSKNINRMTAYSSAAQIGYVYLGLGLGGEAGFTAAMFQILAHAVTKSLLFLTTPRLASSSGDSLLFGRLRGSGKRARFAGVCFTAAALSMVGIPFFAGFSVKLHYAVSAVSSGNPLLMFPILIILGLSSVLNATYYLRTVVTIYSDPWPGEQPDAGKRWKERRPFFAAYAVSAGVLMTGNLALGLAAPQIAEIIRRGLNMFG